MEQLNVVFIRSAKAGSKAPAAFAMKRIPGFEGRVPDLALDAASSTYAWCMVGDA
jgi:hypothetical protein